MDWYWRIHASTPFVHFPQQVALLWQAIPEWDRLEPIPVVTGWGAGYTPDRLMVYLKTSSHLLPNVKQFSHIFLTILEKSSWDMSRVVPSHMWHKTECYIVVGIYHPDAFNETKLPNSPESLFLICSIITQHVCHPIRRLCRRDAYYTFSTKIARGAPRCVGVHMLLLEVMRS